MKIKFIILNIYCIVFLITGFAGCKKYLDAKPDMRLSTPDELADLDAILNSSGINLFISETSNSSDEYYMPADILTALGTYFERQYTWSKKPTDGLSSFEWYMEYRNIFKANTVLDNLERIDPVNRQTEWNRIKGSALFIRANYFYQLAQVYAKQYDINTAAEDLGICLRLNADFNLPSTRATVQQTYNQIIEDLNNALPLLPNIPIYKTRPGRAAVFALLSRTYLTMDDYTKAKNAADSCLDIYNTVIDFNTLDTASPNPISALNSEVIYYGYTGNGLAMLPAPYAYVDSVLAHSYNNDDLRKYIYMSKNGDGSFCYKSIWENGNSLNNSLSTDEMYINRAECYARLGNTIEALKDLNYLLKKRWFTGTFADITASSADEALSIILNERKKELLNRGTRWTDIRRLNKEERFAITLKRITSTGATFVLPPDDPRYVWVIPQEIIDQSGIQQNPR